MDNGEFELIYVKTDQNVAEVFTKALVRDPSFRLCDKGMLRLDPRWYK